MTRAGAKTEEAVLGVLRARGRVDAYQAAKRCEGVNVQEAGRAQLALVASGEAKKVEDGGVNELASVFELIDQ